MNESRNFRLEIATDPAMWDDFAINRSAIFTQSWAWSETLASIGGTPLPLLFTNQGEIAIQALCELVRARRSSYLLLPLGPLFASRDNLSNISVFLEELKRMAEHKKVDFIRICPNAANTASNAMLYKSAGYRPAPMHVFAETTWILDLSPSEETLLAQMRKTNRNLIRRASKDGLEVLHDESDRGITEFLSIYHQTAADRGFIPFTDSLIRNQVQNFRRTNNIRVWLTRYRGRIIAGAIIVYYGSSAFYHHGATLPSYRQLPASYLIQWEAIKDARHHGCGRYDFWGVAPRDNDPHHPFYGITHFKKGFGGYRYDRLHAFDLPLTSKYWLSFLIENIRRRKRGLYFVPPVAEKLAEGS